jgi:hypothetical protein
VTPADEDSLVPIAIVGQKTTSQRVDALALPAGVDFEAGRGREWL